MPANSCSDLREDVAHMKIVLILIIIWYIITLKVLNMSSYYKKNHLYLLSEIFIVKSFFDSYGILIFLAPFLLRQPNGSGAFLMPSHLSSASTFYLKY